MFARWGVAEEQTAYPVLVALLVSACARYRGAIGMLERRSGGAGGSESRRYVRGPVSDPNPCITAHPTEIQ